MPVSARLFRTLNETLSDEAAGDMVSWMQNVDDQRAQLRELHDLGAARIDARFGEMDARISAQFDQVDARFKQIDIRFEQVDARFEQADTRFAHMEAQIVAVESRLGARIDRIDTRLDRIDTELHALAMKVDQRFADVIKWSFVFWCGAVAVWLLGR